MHRLWKWVLRQIDALLLRRDLKNGYNGHQKIDGDIVKTKVDINGWESPVSLWRDFMLIDDPCAGIWSAFSCTLTNIQNSWLGERPWYNIPWSMDEFISRFIPGYMSKYMPELVFSNLYILYKDNQLTSTEFEKYIIAYMENMFIWSYTSFSYTKLATSKYSCT